MGGLTTEVTSFVVVFVIQLSMQLILARQFPPFNLAPGPRFVSWCNNKRLCSGF